MQFVFAFPLSFTAQALLKLCELLDCKQLPCGAKHVLASCEIGRNRQGPNPLCALALLLCVLPDRLKLQLQLLAILLDLSLTMLL